VKKPRQKTNLMARLLAAVAVLSFVTLSSTTLSSTTFAQAQDFPKHPVTMVVPFAAGGTSDVIARAVAEEMGKSLGQPIVIENVAGAGGSTALARAARAEPDGYTIAIGNAGTSAATYTIYPKLPFTPESFVPIAMVAKTFGIVALRKDFPAKTLKEFIAYAKNNPGKINLGHAGVGSSNFLICKSFVQAAGIDVTLVGYRGAAPALTDAIGGQIDGVCDAAASVSQAIDDKLVRGLVVGSTVRLASLAELPTSAEAGLPEFEAQGWNGLFAPKGTPPEIVAKLNAAARAAVESDAVKKRFADLSTVAPDSQRTRARGARAVGDARRREIPQAAGREEVDAAITSTNKKPRPSEASCFGSSVTFRCRNQTSGLSSIRWARD
jgi:tripartite-type tricarboxylate transporter receptor subunit TctC